MPKAHALNLYDSLHMMTAMESLKSFSPVPAPLGFPRPSAIRQSRQQFAIDSQLQSCQQQFQQQSQQQ